MVERVDTLRSELIAAQRDGHTLARIATETGVNRTSISQYVNKGYALSDKNAQAIREYLDMHTSDENDVDDRQYKRSVELYETAEFREAMGFCRYIKTKRKMGILIGYPGSGKTTILKEFARRVPGAYYIECWLSMHMNDLLYALARAAGITVSGNNYAKAQQLIAALSTRDDVMILLDEAEYLKKWDVDKFEVIRKIWDNSQTPVIFAGTPVLESILTRGGGKDNLAQLYRRKYEIRLEGIKKAEVSDILRGYDIAPDAAATLAEIATDARHGGMGNFVELLEISLEAANGGRIDAAIVAGAKQYKLMY